MLLTYSPQRKHRRFSLLLDFRLHSSRSGRFRKNPLPSLKVAADFNVASLGVSVLPLHASLSACNRDTPLFVSCLVGIQRRSQPLIEDFFEAIAIMPFFRTYPMDLFLLSRLMKQHNRFAIHIFPKGRSFLAQIIVKL